MSEHRPEASRVREAASRYRARGYDVILEPSEQDLPAFLPGYRPDFVARLGDERVLVEVAHTPSAEQLAHYREVAEQVHSQRGWRLDLVVSNPSDRVLLGVEYPVLPVEDISRRYEEAEKLLADGHSEAAFLIAWAATEAALRLLASSNALEVHRSVTPVLLKQLVTLGVISRAQYDTLWRSYKQRNAIAHGFAASEAPGTAHTVIALGKEILGEIPRAA
ncbi:MAG: hypothetical protein ACREON_03855 [Gemmatimonadaceae bacterium]